MAGGRAVGRSRDLILSEAQKIFPNLNWVETEHAGHAIQLAAAVDPNVNFDIVIIGGDGTIHEVVNGLFNGASEASGSTLTNPQPKCRVGIINFGRGGDFVRTLKTPNALIEALAVIKQGRTRSIDVGRAQFSTQAENLSSTFAPNSAECSDASKPTTTTTTQYFVNSCSVGLGGRVARSVQRAQSSFPPALVYGQALLQNFSTYRRESMRIEIDGQVVSNGPTTAFLACNGRYSGRGMLWAAEASLDDGLLDVLWVQDLSWTQLLRNFHRIYDGSVGLVPEVRSAKARSIKLQASIPTVLETDGETHSTEDIEISLLPQSLQVFVR